MIECPLCSLEFEEATCHASCPLARGCAMVRCPRCNYEFVKEGFVSRMLSVILSRGEGSQSTQPEILRSAQDDTMTLLNAEAGSTVTVARIVCDSTHRLQRLASLGIVPGVKLRVASKRPTFVLEFDYTSLAIDADVAGEIDVTGS